MTNSKKCPRCNVELKPGKYKEVPIHLCQSCEGILINQPLLYKLLHKLCKDLVSTIDPDYPLEKLPDKGAGINCPACEKTMENYGYMESTFVMIDNCMDCGVIWIDSNELSAMCHLFARSEKRHYAYIKMNELNRMESNNASYILSVSNALGRLYMLNFVAFNIL